MCLTDKNQLSFACKSRCQEYIFTIKFILCQVRRDLSLMIFSIFFSIPQSEDFHKVIP